MLCLSNLLNKRIPHMLSLQQLKPFILILFSSFVLIACSSKSPNTQDSTQYDVFAPTTKQVPKNPLSNIGKSNDDDPLKIGSTPTPPANQAYPKLIVGKIFVDSEKNKDFKRASTPLSDEVFMQKSGLAIPPLGAAPSKAEDDSDWISLMNPNGAVLTVWALAQGNWIWGYTLVDSIDFGDLRVWRFILFENDEVLIQNGGLKTCMNAYKNGIIHMACDKKNLYQRFKLIPMDNGSVQIKNIATNLCIQSPIGDVFGDFHKVSSIFLASCAVSSTLDRQWYITPPPFLVRPLYRKR